MAQVQEKQTSGKRKRGRSNGFHLDMTPMVDLAFLLLTFFMLTTTFTRLQTMELNMPATNGVQTPIPGKNALTVLLGEQDRVFYHFGYLGDDPEVVETSFAASGLRQVLVSDQVRENPKLVVLIKAAETSRFKNLVDALDELRITDTPRYAIAEMQDEDEKYLATR